VNERCETCRWWVLESGPDECGESLGNCHRYPRVLSLGERDRNRWFYEREKGSDDPIRADHSHIHWCFPVMMEGDFCGEWAPKAAD
jgi:hypothetical protein